MTLEEYIKLQGSQEKAARSLGVSNATVNRWVRKHRDPSPMARALLKAVGVYR